MKRHVFLAVLALACLSLVGCKKDEPNPENQGGPGQGGPGQGGPGQGPEGGGPGQPGQPGQGGPGQPGQGGPGQPGQGNQPGTTPPPARTTQPVGVGSGPSVAPIALPEPPNNNLIMVARNAANNCSKPLEPCPARLELTAKLQTEIEQTRTLMNEGTDQEKAAIREALLFARDEKTDPLLVHYLKTPTGQLDPAVVERLVQVRAGEAVEPLAAHLAKAQGTEARRAIDALGRMGNDEARKALAPLLDSAASKPFWGEICQGLSRSLAYDSLEKVGTIGRQDGATRRQAEGCRSALAALKTARTPSQLLVNIGAKRVQNAKMHLFPKGPGQLRAVIGDGNATCEAPGDLGLELTVPLSRTGEPVLGEPVVPSLTHDGRDLGHAPVYVFRLDALEMTRGAGAKGVIFATHAESRHPRLVISGGFEGSWCGGESAAKPSAPAKAAPTTPEPAKTE